MKDELTKTTPAAELDAAIKKLQSQKDIFDNIGMQFLLMSATVFVIGLIVTIISALALSRRRPVVVA